MKVSDYKVVYTDQVTAAISEGWQPWCSPFVIDGDSFQAVVKYVSGASVLC